MVSLFSKYPQSILQHSPPAAVGILTKAKEEVRWSYKQNYNNVMKWHTKYLESCTYLGLSQSSYQWLCSWRVDACISDWEPSLGCTILPTTGFLMNCNEPELPWFDSPLLSLSLKSLKWSSHLIPNHLPLNLSKPLPLYFQIIKWTVICDFFETNDALLMGTSDQMKNVWSSARRLLYTATCAIAACAPLLFVYMLSLVFNFFVYDITMVYYFFGDRGGTPSLLSLPQKYYL